MTEVSSEAAPAVEGFLLRAAVAGLPTLDAPATGALAVGRLMPLAVVAGRALAAAEELSLSPIKSIKAAPLETILGALKTLNFFF